MCWRKKRVPISKLSRENTLAYIPTVAESGFPGYEVTVWWGIATPAGAPRPVMEKLRREITAILQEPETKKRLLTDAAEPLMISPSEIRKVIREDRKKWAEVAKQAGIHVQ